jgi:serine/threonine-protein kinase
MPFHGTQLAEIAVAVMTAAPAPIEIDPTLRGILMRCLEKEPEKRFANVAELAVALMPFGGPSAPRYVRVITGGRVGGQEASGAMHPMMATGPQPAPVPVGQMTAATGVNVGYPAPTGPAPISYPPMQGSAYPPPPMPHGTSPQMAGGTSPHFDTRAAPSRKGKWVAIGIVLVVVLVGGGALAGFLARGTAKGGEAPKDASAVVVADAAPAATPIDAGEATVQRDPWNDGPPPSDASAETTESAEEAEAERIMKEQLQAATKMAKTSMGPYKDQALVGLRLAEKQVESYKNYGADMYEQLLAGYAGTACMLDDAALAKKFYKRITNQESREVAEEQCEMYGHPMKPAAAKAPKPGQAM